jgi:hypothetical protein
MKILSSLNESINMMRINGKNCTEVFNAFFANYLASLILLRLQDLRGLMLINDKPNSKLTRFSSTMSEVNFWGRVIFYPDSEVRSRMLNQQAEILKAMTSPITTVRIQQIMRVPLTAPDQVDWGDVVSSLILLKRRLTYHSSYFDSITYAIYNWDTVSDVVKRKAINNCFLFLLQSDPNSKLTNWFRSRSSDLMLKDVMASSQKLIRFSRITEDEGGGDSGGSSNAIVNPTMTGEIASTTNSETDLGGLFKLVKLSSNQVTKKNKFSIRNGKILVKRKKNFNPKKFKAPDFLKAVKEPSKGKEESNETE